MSLPSPVPKDLKKLIGKYLSDRTTYLYTNEKNFSEQSINTGPSLYVEGLRRTYYDDSKIENNYHYLKGVKHGLQTTYNEDGKVISNENYRNGKRNGLSTFSDEVAVEYVNYKDDIKEGDYKVYDNGNIWKEGQYKNGRMVGIFKIYHYGDGDTDDE